MELDERKQKLRSELIRIRKSFHASPGVCSGVVGRELAKNLKEVLNMTSSKKLCASYQSYGSEIDPSVVVEEVPTWDWIFPRMVGERDLIFYRVCRDGWLKNSVGILEPDPTRSQVVSLDESAAVIVPACGFDQKGNRLGSGRGFYDKALATYKGLKVGVAYAVQVVSEEIPVSSYDVPMDLVVTEKYILSPVKRAVR